ncbi:hypothetical protein M5585_24180 [Serratia ureilytica]
MSIRPAITGCTARKRPIGRGWQNGASALISPGACSGQQSAIAAALTFEDIFTELRELARIFNVSRAGEALVERLRGQLRALEPQRAQLPHLRLLWWYAGAQTPYVAGCCGAPGLLSRSVGSENLFGDRPELWPTVSWKSSPPAIRMRSCLAICRVAASATARRTRSPSGASPADRDAARRASAALRDPPRLRHGPFRPHRGGVGPFDSGPGGLAPQAPTFPTRNLDMTAVSFSSLLDSGSPAGGLHRRAGSAF